MKGFKYLAPIALLLSVPAVEAHCPLCTIGAAAAAGGAAYLGVHGIVIGLFMGAFAVSIGWWVSGLIKKQYFKYQKQAIILLSFLTTVFPMLAILSDVQPFLVSMSGSYGSLLNRTYLIDLFILGSLIGGFIVSITPMLSKKLSGLREGKMMPYQGIILTFGLLIIIGVVLQVIV